MRFFTPKVTRTPKTPNLSVPAIDETQTPAFEYREPYFTEAFDRDWAARLKTNGGLVMVTFVPAFVSEQVRQHSAAERAEKARLEALNPGDPAAV